MTNDQKAWIKILIIFLYLGLFSGIEAQIFLEEGFEGGIRPEGWTEENASGDEPWRYRNGGHSPNDNNWLVPPGETDITRNPPSAAGGTFNAIFFKQGDNNEKTKLITPEMDLLGGTSIELSFYLCQIPWTFEGSTGWDVLRVFYKTSQEGDWILLHEYVDPVYDWEKKTLVLPNPSQSYYVAFEGHTRWGYGTCIDNVVIEEKGTQQLYVGDIDFQQPFANYVPSGMKNVPLLRLDFKVFGNTGVASLDHINFKSLSTNDSDIQSGGLKLYATENQKFSTKNPLGIPAEFVSGSASFQNLNYNLPPGLSYIWLACDINPEANHENKLDVMVEAGEIVVNDTSYPAADQSPEGERVIYKTLYSEDFEGIHEWNLSGEFEIGMPAGSGGAPGNPDPDTAFSGTNILGTDLSGQGLFPYNYEPELNEINSFFAASPAVETFYYKNINIFFQRYMNIEVWDNASVELSYDNGVSWYSVWESNSYINDFSWIQQQISIPDEYARKEQLKIRFKLGPTDGQNNYSGWNIDDLFITGEFISKDAGVSNWVYPLSGSGHTASDSVTVRIANYGGEDITEPVPVAYSFDGGQSWETDTSYQDIAVGDSITFTFPTKVDLSVPGLKPLVLAKTLLPGDQYTSNDEFSTQMYVVPTYSLPYKEEFERNEGYWTSSGNAVWEYGIPAGNTIDSAYSGNHSWVTGTELQYYDLIANKSKIIFEDNFESNNGWSFTGEFERNIPSNMHLPYFSYSGYNCIGTDLSGQGIVPYFYENGINSVNASSATSPAFDVSSYSNLSLSFASWLMIEAGDSVKLEVSPDDGVNWITLWKNKEGEIKNSDYQFHQFYVADSLSYSTKMRFRFTLFYSSVSGPVAEGWNIDDFMLTGDQVNSDAAYLSSPNFDLRGVEYPVFEARLWINTEQDIDGASLLYSLDDGHAWTAVANSSGFDSHWNWYTDKYLETQKRDGWSGQSAGWIKVRHLLPAVLTGKENVRFRLEFNADKFNNEYDGIAMDDVRIYGAPHDVGVNQILEPATACELSENEKFRLRLENFGIRDLHQGDTIKIGYYIEREGIIQKHEENILVPETFPVGEIMDFTMDKEFDFSSGGEYITKVFIIESDPYFYYPSSNDTASVLIRVNKPRVDLGPDIATIHPDTIILSASTGNPGDIYLWQDGTATPDFNVPGEGKYYVTITNDLGCTSSDTVNILRLIPDIGIENLVSPVSDCEIGSDIPVTINVKNFGNDTLDVYDTIYISGLVNQSNNFIDTVYLNTQFLPGESMELTISELFDFSMPGSYNMKIYTKLKNDAVNSNDTISKEIFVFGYPDVDLGPDTVVQSAAYILAPVQGYHKYLWQDGSNGGSFTVEQAGTGKYYVSVEDINACSASDTVIVTLDMMDLEPVEILSPAGNCNLAENIRVSVRVKNSGSQPVPSGETITLGYTINSSNSVYEDVQLTAVLLPDSTFIHTFSQSENLVNGSWYEFSTSVDYAGDMKTFNDVFSKQVGVFEPPVVDLGEDYQVITGLQYLLNAGPGFVSYEWQDGSTGQSFLITEPGIGTYGVKVTDENGCTGFDEAEIMLAVPDIGISEIMNPVTTCGVGNSKHVRIALRNYGNWDIDPQASISVGYILNNGSSVIENITLNETFGNGELIYHSFAPEEDIDLPGIMEITVFTSFADDEIPSNDTLTETVNIYEKPLFDLGNGNDTLLIYEPLMLSVPDQYASYEWQDGSTGNTYEISGAGSNLYRLTVTADNGCIATDSVQVVFDLPDLSVNRIVGPVSACEFNENTMVLIELANNGYYRVEKNDSLRIAYSVDGNQEFTETIKFNNALLPGNTRVFTFSKPYNFSLTGTYTLDVSIDFEGDSDGSNDSMNSLVENWGNPEFVLGNGEDTLNLTLPYILEAPAGYNSYRWQDNSSGSSLRIIQPGLYWVKVGNERGCMSSDSVVIQYPLSFEKNVINPESIQIYPNPADNYVNVSMNLNEAQEILLEIYSITNQLQFYKQMERVKNIREEINLSSFSSGLYIMRIAVDKEIYTYLLTVK